MRLDHFCKVGVWIGIVGASVFEILYHQLVRFHNHAASDSLAGEIVGDVFELIIDCAVDLRNGIIEEGSGDFGRMMAEIRSASRWELSRSLAICSSV